MCKNTGHQEYADSKGWSKHEFKDILKVAEKDLMDIEIGKWKKEHGQQSKLRTYCTYKKEFETEQYVKMPLTRSDRSMLARFRAGVLPLAIETGRYLGQKAEDRKCVFCDLNQTETEDHFIFKCPLYLNLRLNFFLKIDDYMPEFRDKSVPEKYHILMTDRKLIVLFSHYLRSSWSLRQDTLFR